EIPRRHFGRVAVRRFYFVAVLLRFHILLANQRNRFGACAWKGRRPPGVCSVRHLHAAGNAAIGKVDEEIFDRITLAQLEVKRLPAEKVSRAGHYIRGSYAAGASFFDARITNVHGVEDAYIWLDRATAITAFGRSNMAVRVD